MSRGIDINDLYCVVCGEKTKKTSPICSKIVMVSGPLFLFVAGEGGPMLGQ